MVLTKSVVLIAGQTSSKELGHKGGPAPSIHSEYSAFRFHQLASDGLTVHGQRNKQLAVGPMAQGNFEP